jgi:hypothetical protein
VIPRNLNFGNIIWFMLSTIGVEPDLWMNLLAVPA